MTIAPSNVSQCLFTRFYVSAKSYLLLKQTKRFGREAVALILINAILLQTVFASGAQPRAAAVNLRNAQT